MTQHAELTPERWSRFSVGQQIVQIGVEMHRAVASLREDRLPSLRSSYERTLRLVDLTVEVNESRSLRRELLRWRDVVAGLYVGDAPDPEGHRRALRVVLLMDSDAAKQVVALGL